MLTGLGEECDDAAHRLMRSHYERGGRAQRGAACGNLARSFSIVVDAPLLRSRKRDFALARPDAEPEANNDACGPYCAFQDATTVSLQRQRA